jgi:hypothetical protein
MFKLILTASFSMLLFVPQPARADYMVDFIRIACVPEAGFFDIDHRLIHNNAAESASSRVWARQGFYTPSDLTYECDLGPVKYKLSAHQNNWTGGMCGAAPEIFLTLFRDDRVIANKVVFGLSCLGHPTITRISMTEAKSGYHGRESQICYLKRGDESEHPECKWFFNMDENDDVFPLRQNTLIEHFRKWRPRYPSGNPSE